MSRPSFIDMMYRVLTDMQPARDAPLRDVMETVMKEWCFTRVTTSEPARQCARIALCQIAMRWHPSDRFTYAFEDIVKKFVEISPELKGKEITAFTMRDVLLQNHLSVLHH